MTDAECSKKDFIKFVTEYASISEDEAGKIWGSVSYWAEPYDVYTIADEEAYFDHCSKRKCDALVNSIIFTMQLSCSGVALSGVMGPHSHALVTYGTHGFVQSQCF